MSKLQGPITPARSRFDINGSLLAPFIYLFERVRSSIEERIERFDARFGTDTAAPTYSRRERPDSHAYVPTTASVIYETLASLPIEPGKFTFVDMGSGKGRALLVASEFAFAKIVGVELAKDLHEIAQTNVGRYRPPTQKCRTFDLHCMSAEDYQFGDEPLVLFLYDPFGRETVGRVFANLEASLSAKPRKTYIVYIYPLFEDVFQASAEFRKVSEGGPRWRPWSRYVVYETPVAGAEHIGKAADAPTVVRATVADLVSARVTQVAPAISTLAAL